MHSVIVGEVGTHTSLQASGHGARKHGTQHIGMQHTMQAGWPPTHPAPSPIKLAQPLEGRGEHVLQLEAHGAGGGGKPAGTTKQEHECTGSGERKLLVVTTAAHSCATNPGIRHFLSQQSARCSLLGVGHQLAHRVARHLDALPPHVKPHCRAGGWAREENRAWQTKWAEVVTECIHDKVRDSHCAAALQVRGIDTTRWPGERTRHAAAAHKVGASSSQDAAARPHIQELHPSDG